MVKPRIIAFYLPQYHPFKENDEWWGKGFTEWTNVGKAKPLFKGHNQPRIPADLGYYDLRVKEVREQQAELAREAGVEGFCYWHYWFNQNRQFMDDVFNEVLETGTPTLPFCLGWANHSWYAKTWNKDVPDKLLCEQEYLGHEDYNAHFNYVLKAFKDERYIKIEGCPLFYIFDPLSLPSDFIPYWNKLAVEHGFKKIYFVGKLTKVENEAKLLQKGFSALVPERMGEAYGHNPIWLRVILRFFKFFSNKPKFCYSYEYASKFFINEEDKKEYIIPQIIPQWDHSPRSATRGTILYNSTPKLFAKHVRAAIEAVKNKRNPIIFLKSWNEWAEGNMMEPDLTFGKGYINALREEIDR
jgi:hypothetical protein